MGILISFKLHHIRSQHFFYCLNGLLDFPSVCGWKAVLKCNLVPNAFCKLCQNLDVNRKSHSDTIKTGTLCNLTMSSINNFASLWREKVSLTDKKCANFVSWSIITRLPLCRLWVQGSLNKKFIVMCSHFHSGID